MAIVEAFDSAQADIAFLFYEKRFYLFPRFKKIFKAKV